MEGPWLFNPPFLAKWAIIYYILLMEEILHQLRLVGYPIIYRFFLTSQVASQISSINSTTLSKLDGNFYLTNRPGLFYWRAKL